jgi:hypothetical protein
MQGRTDGKANDRREERSMKTLTRTTSAVAKTTVFPTSNGGWRSLALIVKQTVRF